MLKYAPIMTHRQWPSNRILTAWILKVFFWITLLNGPLFLGVWEYSRWAGEGDATAQLDILFAALPILRWVNIISLVIIIVLSLLLIFVWVLRREKADEPKQED